MISIYCEELDGECFDSHNCESCEYNTSNKHKPLPSPELTDELKKAEFCKRFLLPLCHYTSSDVLDIVYSIDGETQQETATIIFKTSSGEYKKPVNVTADSLTALARDVLKYI